MASLVGVCILHPWLTPNLNAPSYANYSVSPNSYPFCITINNTLLLRVALLFCYRTRMYGPGDATVHHRSRPNIEDSYIPRPACGFQRNVSAEYVGVLCRSVSMGDKRFQTIKELGKGTTHRPESSQATDLVGRYQGTEDTGKMVLQ